MCIRDRHGEVRPGRDLRHDGEDATWRGGRSKRSTQQHVGRHPGHAATDEGEDQGRLHQRVGEVHLVDATDELDERRAGSRSPGSADAEEREGEKQPDTRAGVGFQKEQDRPAGLRGLLGTCLLYTSRCV